MYGLLNTKLYLPRRRHNSVTRPRLTDRLRAGTDRPLTLITAPAGFGKTTLLSEWIPQSEHCVTWVSLDDGDNDPARFWSYFIAALQMLAAEIGRDALALLQSLHPPPIETILTVLLNEIAGFPDRFVQVLDDYQVIHSQSIHAGLLFFLEHMPPRMHLIISSRTDPPLPLGRLRGRDLLNEIRSADLRFTPDEAALFLNQAMGLKLSLEDVVSLENHTEGWIAGLQLAALALQGRSLEPDGQIVSEFIQAFTGSHRYIVSYLVEEVFNQRPKGTLDFLLQTSILDRLSGPLCDYVLEKSGIEGDDDPGKPGPDSQSILEQLERANLFIVPLDETGQWYRYHHLFAEVLRVRLRKSQPDRLRELHLRAGEWYERSGFIPEAVRHVLEAGAWERAARLIEQNAIVYGSQGQIQLVLTWLAALPESVIRANPLLCIFHAGALTHYNGLADAEARLQDAEAAIHADTPRDRERLIRGRVSMLRSNLARIRGDIQGCVELSRRALALLPRTDTVARASTGLNLACRFLYSGNVNRKNECLVTTMLDSVRATGNVYTTLRGTILLAELYALQGRLHRCEEIYEAASRQNGVNLLTAIPGYFFGLGDLKREWNDLDEAVRLLEQGMVHTWRQVFDGWGLLHGCQSLARLKQARGDTAGAKAALQGFTQLAQQHNFTAGLLASAAAVQAWIDLMAGNIPAAAEWAESRELQVDAELSFPREREYLTLARLLIRTGRAPKALQLLHRLRAAAQAGGRLGSLVEILCLNAQALQSIGYLDRARKSIEQALTLAGPAGYLRIFVDEGEPVRLLLSDFRSSIENQPARPPSLSAYTDRILAAFPVATPWVPAVQPRESKIPHLLESLSDRELAVLRLIAAGASNREIAETLSIALSTVKRHTGNLYSKLGVSSRTQAIGRAQSLRLLS